MKVTLMRSTFEGVLQVTDPVLFRQALTKGIGRAKAYGMSLLTIVRL
jgi:CRISPR system Cascade subunit CasE